MKLKHINKKNPFKVPDQYFDTVEDHIWNRIREEENHSTGNGRILVFRKMIAVAACFALILTGVYLFYKDRDHHTDFVVHTQPEVDSFYQFFYTSEIVAYAGYLEMSDQEIISDEEIYLSDLEEEAIICYLERDNLSLSTIIHMMDADSFY